ncbi:MAG: carboxypeptidase-like regulatory domain-containing protein, partial [Ferruginibacter sp.]|nr:carboxypeptidase-like regulatory domain-containing protein [Ferruginibacter sp.]
MYKLTLLLLIIFISISTKAQKISGTIKDDNGKPISEATIILKNQNDSAIIKYSRSVKDGGFVFNAVSTGKYVLQISHVGYVSTTSPVINMESADVVLKEIILPTSATKLAEVSVTAKKPIVEVRADKTILNVEGTINAVGNDALELLRKSPGVMVDKDDNLSLSGKNGVQVYIDGKPSPLSGTDLSNYLKSIQSTQIESIELITN